MTTLLSTFYSFQPLVASAHMFSPSRIMLVIAEDSFSRQEVQEGLEKAREVYGNVASVEVVRVDGADLMVIASKIVEILEKLPEKPIVNVSGGWKLLAQGVLYACYARPSLVEKVVCNNIQDNSVVELPKLSFGLSKAKERLLAELAKRKGRSISEIAKNMTKTRGMIYQHLKELKDNGYVDEKFEVTMAGKLALL